MEKHCPYLPGDVGLLILHPGPSYAFFYFSLNFSLFSCPFNLRSQLSIKKENREYSEWENVIKILNIYPFQYLLLSFSL